MHNYIKYVLTGLNMSLHFQSENRICLIPTALARSSLHLKRRWKLLNWLVKRNNDFDDRDPTVEFPPDMCSRVTFVNFTVTRSSLQSQCLHRVLKAERPDIDTKRSDLLKLQGKVLEIILL